MKKYAIILLILVPVCNYAQNRGNKNANEKKQGLFYNQVPAHLYDIILSRPTDKSISVSLMANDKLDGYIAFGKSPDKLTAKTKMISITKGKPVIFLLDKLENSTKYYYSFYYIQPGDTSNLQSSAINFFTTQRKPGSDFVFTIQADSHLDENADTAMYKKTLNNMASDSADFLIDLGDTWMTDKYRPDFKESEKQYIAQRYYFETVCKSSPLFLTLGNHDAESGKGLKQRNNEQGIADWATSTRKYYYANPEPDNFYTGNTQNDENYYSWQWGDALFIVLDPFRYTGDNKDSWQRTLGDAQYNWLKKTLQNSKAKFRFVFMHNLVGGMDNNGIARGGAEAAKFFEWGGLNADSTEGFASHRPGWDMPIHDLLVKYRVNAVFHGHDHFFAKQDAGGLVYQLLPQPAAIRYGNINSAKEYGYINGINKNAPGYLRVTIKGSSATVDYIQTSLDSKHSNKEVLYSYNLEMK